MSPLPARQQLRVSCADAHAAVDALFSRFDLGVAREYGRFLRAHAAAALPIERALGAQGMAQAFPPWAEHRRADALRADLVALDSEPPEALTAPSLHRPAQLWGAAYVLEGSRLGGRALAGRVARGLPRQYLATSAGPAYWPAFLTALDVVLASAEAQAEAATAAQPVFALFMTAAQHELETALP